MTGVIPGRSPDRRRIGALGESIAAQYLERKGYEVLEKNFRRPYGEIDIVALKGNVVRIVEVKTVTRERLPSAKTEEGDYRPEEMVHDQKLRKLARVAEAYMNQRRDQREYQIDVVGVFLDETTRKARCRLFEQVL